MKLYTKIFLSFFILIAAAFCLCGTWMISASFDAAKKREIQMGMSRNELYRTTFRSAADSVPADYFTTHHSLREIVVALKDGMDDKNGAFCLYDENKNIVYSTIEEKQDVALLEKVDKQHKAYKIEEKDGKYTLRVVSYMMLSANFKGYYVETQTNIGSAYTQRQDMVRMYHYIVCVVLLCCVIVSLILSYFLTYRIRGLSLSARAFADGDMDRRALVRGKDEVAVLSADFNQMADSLRKKQKWKNMPKARQLYGAFARTKTPSLLLSASGTDPVHGPVQGRGNDGSGLHLFPGKKTGIPFLQTARSVCAAAGTKAGKPGKDGKSGRRNERDHGTDPGKKTAETDALDGTVYIDRRKRSADFPAL